jgi:hypothetical protein
LQDVRKWSIGTRAVGRQSSGLGIASGYIVFFTYSALIGVLAIILSFAVLKREQSAPSP